VERTTAAGPEYGGIRYIGMAFSKSTSGRRGNVWSAGQLHFRTSPLLYADEKG